MSLDYLSTGRIDANANPVVRFGPRLIYCLVRRIVVGFCRRRDYDYLAGLPDHLLKDIGVTREEVARARSFAFGMPLSGFESERFDRDPSSLRPTSQPDFGFRPGE